MIGRAFPLLAATFVFAVSGYAVQVVLARELGPIDFGVVGLALAVVSLLNVVQASGAPQSVSLTVAAGEQDPRSVLSAGLRLEARVSVVLVVVLVAVAPLAAVGFDEPDLTRGLWVLALMIPGFGVMVTLGGFWNGTQQFARQGSVTIAYSLAKVVLIVALAWQFGPIGALVGYALAPMAGVFAGARGVPRVPQRPPPVTLVRSGMLVMVALLTLALYSTDLFVVRLLVDDSAAAGHYVAAQSIALIPIMCAMPFAQVVLPRVAAAHANHGHELAGHAVSQAMRQGAMIVVPLAAALSAAAPEVATLLFGNDYVDTGDVARILVCSGALVGLLLIAIGGLCGAGKPSAAVACLVSSLGLSVAVGSVLVDQHGPVGAALGVAAGAAIGILASLVLLRDAAPVDLAPTVLVRIASAAGLAWFAAGWADGPLQTGAALTAAVVLGFGVYWLAGEFSAQEKRRLVSLLGVGDGRRRDR